jgi:hypothetical protein
MPTILLQHGWRFYFYANERGEPIHVHAQRGEAECKFWIDAGAFDVREAFAYNLSPRDRREVRKIIFEHFDYIVHAWSDTQEGRE